MRMYFSRAETEFRQRTTIWFQREAVQERKSDDREEFQAYSQARSGQGRFGVQISLAGALRKPCTSIARFLGE